MSRSHQHIGESGAHSTRTFVRRQYAINFVFRCWASKNLHKHTSRSSVNVSTNKFQLATSPDHVDHTVAGSMTNAVHRSGYCVPPNDLFMLPVQRYRLTSVLRRPCVLHDVSTMSYCLKNDLPSGLTLSSKISPIITGRSTNYSVEKKQTICWPLIFINISWIRSQTFVSSFSCASPLCWQVQIRIRRK